MARAGVSPARAPLKNALAATLPVSSMTFLSPPSLRDTSPYIPVSYHFFTEKMVRESEERFIQDRHRRHAMRLTAGFFPLSRRCRSFHLVSVFHKGKKDITSDALFADSCQRFYLFYRNPAFLSPPSLRDTSPYHKGRHKAGFRCFSFAGQNKSNE